jgi:hypothetical protein
MSRAGNRTRRVDEPQLLEARTNTEHASPMNVAGFPGPVRFNRRPNGTNRRGSGGWYALQTAAGGGRYALNAGGRGAGTHPTQHRTRNERTPNGVTSDKVQYV